MWIGQGKSTTAGRFRFVLRILTFYSHRYCGLVKVISSRTLRELWKAVCGIDIQVFVSEKRSEKLTFRHFSIVSLISFRV